MTHLDWSDLCTERAAIMQHDGGLAEPLARKLAWADTVERFGPPPEAPEPPAAGRNRAKFRPDDDSRTFYRR